MPRVDAQRNIDALLAAAKEEFAAQGVNVHVRAIAARAGVGTATLYRHFPLRSDLICAVFRREVDACAAEAPQLAASHEPGEALELWLQRYTGFVATKRGLAAALHSGDPAFNGLPAYFHDHLGPALGDAARQRRGGRRDPGRRGSARPARRGRESLRPRARHRGHLARLPDGRAAPRRAAVRREPRARAAELIGRPEPGCPAAAPRRSRHRAESRVASGPCGCSSWKTNEGWPPPSGAAWPPRASRSTWPITGRTACTPPARAGTTPWCWT